MTNLDNATTTTASEASKNVHRKAMLIPPLLFALWLLTDDETSNISTTPHHHLASMTALIRHPPCLRVYRALFEIVLGLFCTAFSLKVWESTKQLEDGSIIGYLLFGPAPYKESKGVMDSMDEEEYVPVSAADDDDDAWEDSNKKQNSNETDEFLDLNGGGGGGGGDEVPISACDAATPNKSDEDENVDDLPISPPPSSSSRLASSIDDDNVTKNDFQSKPPTSMSVLGAAIDLLLVTLVSLFLFTISSAEGGRYIDKTTPSIFEKISDVAAPIFPLVLFLVGVFKVLVPWKRKRRDFWFIISLTVCAPYHDVTFRDGFIGDILTSTVRPLQDIAFTTFYIVSGLQGWWTKSYGIDDAAVPVEHSWLLHTVVLPACMISPLWWRFLQNLRQTHDAKQRWPYLGNAFKYFVAAEVAVFGLFDPSKKQTYTWIASFVFATLYQIWWDVFMDWELLVWKDEPSSFGIRWPFALRSQRLYKWRSTYYFIFVINVLLRFCWTLSFIPMRYLTQSGILADHFRSDFQTLVGPAMASAEIIRRTLWGLIRVELEALKTFDKEKEMSRSEIELPNMDKEGGNLIDMLNKEDQQWELKPMSIESSGGRNGAFSFLRSSLKSHAAIVQSDMSSSTDLQILCELCLYATIFTSMGMIAAAHRQVM